MRENHFVQAIAPSPQEAECSRIYYSRMVSETGQGFPSKARGNVRGFPSYPSNLFIFDEGQDTYHDLDLWNFFFKGIRSMGNMYVALFCCYGSSSSQIAAPTHGNTTHIIQPPESGTLDVFSEFQRLSLLPTTDTPLGLFMSPGEFEDLLSRYPHPLNLADDVKREILKWSAGHIGGIEYLLDSIRREVSFHCSVSGV